MKADRAKLSIDKPDYSLIPPRQMSEVAKVFTYGAIEHEPGDWYRGADWSVYEAAIARHFEAWRMGQVLDADSGLHPLAHAIADMLILMCYDQNQIGNDDRHLMQFKSIVQRMADGKIFTRVSSMGEPESDLTTRESTDEFSGTLDASLDPVRSERYSPIDI